MEQWMYRVNGDILWIAIQIGIQIAIQIAI